ncbi:MAG: SBBP repeat-containing protein [Acidimicrobiales bacterium]
MRLPGTHRPAVVLALLGMVLACALTTTFALLRRQPAPAVPAAPAHDLVASLPVAFEPAGDGSFASRGPGYSLVLTASEAVVGVRGGTFALRPAGPSANPAAPLVPAQPLGGAVTRLTGDDPSAWRTGLATYGRVEARQVWPGVDVVWHGDQRRLEHDMVVAPGTDPAVVAFDVQGAQAVTVAPDGDLLVDLGGGSAARLGRPVAYQEMAAGGRQPVASEFALLGPSRIGFRVGPYDRDLPLVIDPTLVTSTFLGGIGNDGGYAIAVDGQGNTYVTGATESQDFPTNAPLQAALSNSAAGATSDVFVSKISPDGSRLLWSTYLGGGGRDTGYAVAVGSDGAVYVAGVTESSDFPRANPAQNTFGGGSSDAFVAKLAPSGTTLEWSTYIGGTATDRGRGLAVDSTGNAYVTGSTSSVDFPTASPYQPGPFRPDDLDAFLTKVPAGGGPLAYSTRLGGSNDDHGLAVAVDSQNNAYVTGDTLSPGFPTVRPIQAGSGGSASGVAGSFPDAFVTKFNPAGTALVYSTFLGGSDLDQGTAITVDAAGAAYVAGNTNSPNFPTVTPLQAAKGNDTDAFVAKLDAPGASLLYATYVGGSGADGANGIAVDRSGSPVVVGTTGSANWPTRGPVQPSRGGSDDAFVLKLTADGRGSVFSTYLGGREADSGMGVAVDAQGAAHVLGLTGSPDFPSVKPVVGSRPATGGDAFVATIDLADAAGPAPSAAAAPAPGGTTSSSSSTTGHDRRIRALGILTLVLLAAAVGQTVYLRRRPAVPAGRPPTKPAPPAPAKPARTPAASPGVTVLGAGGASKSTRTPKARGGPKSGPAKAGTQKAGSQKGGAKKAGTGRPGGQKTAAAAKAGALGGAAPDADGVGADDGGPPTVAAPPPAPPRRIKPQEPAVAQLLEEDLWAPEPPVELPEQPSEEPADQRERPAAKEAAAPIDTGEVPAVEVPATEAAEAAGPTEAAETREAAGEAAPQPPAAAEPVEVPPAPAIPPVPAEELSFWDLFPEDLPPARATTFPVEDLLVEHIPLPEGPDSAAGRLLGPPEPGEQPGPPDPDPEAPLALPPHPPEAEIVIAELLDGPLPTGLRPSDESPWAPQTPGDDFVISDLLADQKGDDRPGAGRPPVASGPDDEDGPAPTPGPARDQQARIAADRARRRRARRGRGKSPGSG